MIIIIIDLKFLQNGEHLGRHLRRIWRWFEFERHFIAACAQKKKNLFCNEIPIHLSFSDPNLLFPVSPLTPPIVGPDTVLLIDSVRASL